MVGLISFHLVSFDGFYLKLEKIIRFKSFKDGPSKIFGSILPIKKNFKGIFQKDLTIILFGLLLSMGLVFWNCIRDMVLETVPQKLINFFLLFLQFF